mmetsp:Transcript_86590/g.220611  ORF Transcript_86590/g.220611 Transcript_86590/m.220611 type:complete len:81 (-) Transcript_86590:1151-1393(-)
MRALSHAATHSLLACQAQFRALLRYVASKSAPFEMPCFAPAAKSPQSTLLPVLERAGWSGDSPSPKKEDDEMAPAPENLL